MFKGIQKNFLLIWVVVLLTIAIVLSLTFSSCSNSEVSLEEESAGKATNVISSPNVQDVCSDSDSKDINVKGVTKSGETSYVDKCAGPFLIEYYCEDGKIVNQNFKCPGKCEKGKCI